MQQLIDNHCLPLKVNHTPQTMSHGWERDGFSLTCTVLNRFSPAPFPQTHLGRRCDVCVRVSRLFLPRTYLIDTYMAARGGRAVTSLVPISRLFMPKHTYLQMTVIVLFSAQCELPACLSPSSPQLSSLIMYLFSTRRRCVYRYSGEISGFHSNRSQSEWVLRYPSPSNHIQEGARAIITSKTEWQMPD